MTEVIRLLDIRDTPLAVDEVYDAVRADTAGGVALFVGTVRDHDENKPVEALGYSAHSTAKAALQAVVVGVAERRPEVVAAAAVHRVGDLRIGDIAVIVAVACTHRGDAFLACQELIDDLKASVRIWKHQVFADGGEEWVGTSVSGS